MTLRHLAALAALAALSLPLVAAADGHRGASVTIPAKYRSECASCHVPYAPGLLPAASWARIMSNLKNHYGTDASLDAASVTEISTWLAANAGRAGRAAPAEDRITQTAWFVHEHRKIAAAVWRLPAIGTPSNCMACHRGAEQGDFDEHDVRIPR